MLETLSQTDIKCSWAEQKISTNERYKPVPIKEMPCFKDKWPKLNMQISNDMHKQIFNIMLLHARNSAVNLNQ